MDDPRSNFNRFPIWFDPPSMAVPNEDILIYKGIFILKNGEKRVEIDGNLTFRWFPSKGVVFEGVSINEAFDLFSFYATDNDFEILVKDNVAGTGFITYMGDTIRGVINNAVLGDKNLEVEKVSFSIPNLRELHGMAVTNEGLTSFHHGRLIFENDDFLIEVDKRFDYRVHQKELRKRGGYYLFYSGELSSKSGLVKLEKATKVFSCLGIFLNFLQGGRISILFQEGLLEKKIIWTNLPSGQVQPYNDGVFSWIPDNVPTQYSELWKSFYSLWFKKKENDFLRNAIHWYIEANNYQFVEGALVMAQNALELIYYWWIVETKGMIGGRDAETIGAANRIRLILANLDITSDVPGDLSDLRKYGIGEQLEDGPEKIVHLRNSIVHSKKSKRKKLAEVTLKAKYEGLHLSLYYVELALLKILDYQGSFINRTKKTKIEGKTELVPWVNA